jgi:hypothetical protein
MVLQHSKEGAAVSSSLRRLGSTVAVAAALSAAGVAVAAQASADNYRLARIVDFTGPTALADCQNQAHLDVYVTERYDAAFCTQKTGFVELRDYYILSP